MGRVSCQFALRVLQVRFSRLQFCRRKPFFSCWFFGKGQELLEKTSSISFAAAMIGEETAPCVENSLVSSLN